jgi:hypothetical protein
MEIMGNEQKPGEKPDAYAAILRAASLSEIGVFEPDSGVQIGGRPMAREGWFGLYIEFKATPPHAAPVSDSQTAFLMAVEQQGYMAIVCRGMDEAMQVIDGYMAHSPTQAVKA